AKGHTSVSPECCKVDCTALLADCGLQWAIRIPGTGRPGGLCYVPRRGEKLVYGGSASDLHMNAGSLTCRSAGTVVRLRDGFRCERLPRNARPGSVGIIAPGDGAGADDVLADRHCNATTGLTKHERHGCTLALKGDQPVLRFIARLRDDPACCQDEVQG